VRIAIALGVLVGCGPGASDAPSATGSAAVPAAGLHPYARYPDATLVVGSRRVAVLAGDRWLEPVAGGLREDRAVGTSVANARATLGGDVQIFLGAAPIVLGGDEHREAHVRITPAPQPIEAEGLLARVAARRDGTELWQLDDRLRTQLAVVDAAGTVRALPEYPLIGPAVVGLSPVKAKLCATPHLQDLATTGDDVLALVTECSLDAPVRIVRYRWPGPVATVERLRSASELGFEPTRLVVARDGSRALVGVARGHVVVGRVAADGKVTPVASLANVTRLAAAAIGDDAAVWTLTLGSADGADRWQVARDGELVAVVDRSGRALRPTQLAFDEHLGIVVVATSTDETWLAIERALEPIR
jgi:hypothetical protein